MGIDWDSIVAGCGNANEPAGIKCLEALFANVIVALVALSTVALFIMLIVGGFKYLTSTGDAKKAQSARNTILWAIVGIVIMISSYIILSAIKAFTGINVLEFRIPAF